MTSKSSKIAAVLTRLPAPRGDTVRYHPLYLGFFTCFNAQMFYEAHEVLEELWRETPKPVAGASPTTTNWQFYKGLIQMAGAFVHLQKANINGASRLLVRARENLAPYGVRRLVAAFSSGDSSPESITLGVTSRAAQSADKSAHSKTAPCEGTQPTIRLHEGLDVAALIGVLERWGTEVEAALGRGGNNPFSPDRAPQLAPEGVEV